MKRTHATARTAVIVAILAPAVAACCGGGSALLQWYVNPDDGGQ